MIHPKNRAAARRPFSSWPPLAKIGAWVALLAAMAMAVQSLAWLVGSGFSVLANGGGGRGTLLALALASLLAIMSADRRPLAEYGLAVDAHWARRLLWGFAVGALTYAAYCLLAVAAGAATLRSDIALARWLRAVVSGTTAFPVAIVQQIIFSGYLLSVFRARYSRVTSVLAVATVFALLNRIEDPLSTFSAAKLPLAVGMFFIGGLLALVRVQTGSILLPAGLLAGWIFVRRVMRRTDLLLPNAQSEWGDWFMRLGDPRQGTLLWLLLATAAAVYLILLARRGEPRHSVQAAPLAGSFKRVFPLSNTGMLAPLDLWLRCLADARFRVGLIYLPRLVAILVLSTLNTVLSLPERLLLPWLVRRRPVADPVFIVGLHRSGTTHLHNLLALDPNFVTPRAYHIVNPVGFLFSGWLVTPILGAFMPWERPMDAVRFHLFTPNEEEFALAGVTRMSPYWGLTFPRRGAQYDRFIYPEQLSGGELRSWKRHYLLLLRKLTFWRARRPLLKNPFNTARVALLAEMFPRARFVHIYRHPSTVYRSNRHMAAEAHPLLQLQDPVHESRYMSRFLGHYRAMEDAFYRDAAKLAPSQVAEVRFEDLERDPAAEIRRVYRQLELTVDPRFEERLKRYLATVADYRKNRFQPLPADEQAAVQEAMGPYFGRWGYTADGSSESTVPRAA